MTSFPVTWRRCLQRLAWTVSSRSRPANQQRRRTSCFHWPTNTLSFAASSGGLISSPPICTRACRSGTATRKLKGFRHIAQGEPDDFLARSDVIAGISQLGDAGFTYDILIYPRQLAAAEQLVARCPGVRFILDHCAKPPIVSGEIVEWRRGLRALARHANVTCKLSGLVTEAAWNTWSDADLEPYLDSAAQAFGPDRLMFGSDWPVCLLAAEYAEVAGAVARWAERLSISERESVFGGTARMVYRLDS